MNLMKLLNSLSRRAGGEEIQGLMGHWMVLECGPSGSAQEGPSGPS